MYTFRYILNGNAAYSKYIFAYVIRIGKFLSHNFKCILFLHKGKFSSSYVVGSLWRYPSSRRKLDSFLEYICLTEFQYT